MDMHILNMLFSKFNKKEHCSNRLIKYIKKYVDFVSMEKTIMTYFQSRKIKYLYWLLQ